MNLTELNEEQLVEKPAERIFEELGYETIYGPSIHPGTENAERDSLYQVLLKSRLLAKLVQLNPNLPQDVYDIAIKQIEGLSQPSLLENNREFHQMVLAGIKEASTNKVVGDISFNTLEKPSITFTQITDPETLSTAVRRLKEKHSSTMIDGKEEKNIPESKVGFVRCSACENENLLGSKFCNKCGSALSVSSCNKCGQLNIVGAIFCSNCGSKFH